MNGILDIYKEKGPTSFDVVDRVRHILHIKKAGHAGTLDPEAEGVLPVCLGKATKVSSMISDLGKTYRTVMLLGTTTDTQDLSGSILSQVSADVPEDEVRAATESFAGSYDQIPPMYSARKVKGRRLYELARAGEEVERQPKRVSIESIVIDDIKLPRVTMTVSCSKGTYIRTLCSDIGQKIGCGACMESLLRTRVGRFELKDALTLSQIEDLNEKGLINTAIYPLDGLFADLASLTVTGGGEGDKLLHNGNPVPEKFVNASGSAGDRRGEVRIYDSEGEFAGVYVYDVEKEAYKPERFFL